MSKVAKPTAKADKHESLVGRGRSALSSEESESSSVCRRKNFRRACCHEIKLVDHNKPEKEPKIPWARNEYQVFSLKNKRKNSKEGQLSAKVKDLRRKQFFNFLADFFDKFEAGQMKGKVGNNFKFDDEEKEKWLKKYFKKYYMENQVVEDIVVKLKLDTDQAARKRQCSCTVGQRDEATGELIPPCVLHQKRPQPDKYVTVHMQPELATREMKDA